MPLIQPAGCCSIHTPACPFRFSGNSTTILLMTAPGAQTVSLSLFFSVLPTTQKEKTPGLSVCEQQVGGKRKRETLFLFILELHPPKALKRKKREKNTFTVAHGLEQQPNKVLKKRYWPNLQQPQPLHKGFTDDRSWGWSSTAWFHLILALTITSLFPGLSVLQDKALTCKPSFYLKLSYLWQSQMTHNASERTRQPTLTGLFCTLNSTFVNFCNSPLYND